MVRCASGVTMMSERAVKALGITVFRYWNSVVETSLKGRGYDFSRMPDKDEAAKLAEIQAITDETWESLKASTDSVWEALKDIPYGETRSYGEIARAIHSPRAYRAV